MSYESNWMGRDWDLQLCGSDSELLTINFLNFVTEGSEKKIKVKGTSTYWGTECTYTEATGSTPATLEGSHGAAKKKFKITLGESEDEPTKMELTCQWDPPPPPPDKKDGGDGSDITWRALEGAR